MGFGSGYKLAGKSTKVQKVTVVKTKKHKKKGLKKVVFKPKNNKVLPDCLKVALPLPLWGTITSGGSGAANCYICANTIITSSGAGPLVAGNLAATRFTSSAAGSMYALQSTASTVPTGFSILFAPTTGTACLYGKYVVTDLSYTIEFTPVASADDLHLCVYPEKVATTSSVTTFSTLNEVLVAPFAKSKIISYIHSKSENTLKGKIDIAKFLGVTRQELLNNPAYAGTVETTGLTYPSERVNLVFWQNNTRNVANTNAIPFKMKFVYHICFTEEAGRMMPE